MCKIKYKKRIGFLLYCLILFVSLEIRVEAEEYHRRDEIKSQGSIRFEQGEVYITSDDFRYLADKMDALENTYKSTLVDTLNQINVYFKNDGTVVYDGGLNEVDTDEEKGKFSFGFIKNGILKSQSVESVYQTQATDGSGNPWYFANEEAKNNGDHLNITTSDTGFPLYYKEANVGNLSAGYAAWVNGVLIKGTGEDNRNSWSNGYNEGYTKGVADALGKVNIVYSYHSHAGSASQVGGCYGNLTGTRPVYCGCEHYVYDKDENGHTRCANCHHNHGGDTCDAVRSYTSYTYIGLVCGKTEQTIESATIIY